MPPAAAIAAAPAAAEAAEPAAAPSPLSPSGALALIGWARGEWPSDTYFDNGNNVIGG